MRFVRAKDSAIFGVCKGLAKAFDIPVGWVRLIWLTSLLFFGAGLFLYLALAMTLPREDKTTAAMNPKILGVCAKLAKRSNGEVGLLRFLAVCLLIMSFGSAVVGYLVLYFVVDEPGTYSSNVNPATPSQTT